MAQRIHVRRFGHRAPQDALPFGCNSFKPRTEIQKTEQ
jgi:hypothetical protein